MEADDDVIYEILQNTARTEERTRHIEESLEDLREQYVAESEKRDERINKLESRVDRHTVILSGGLFTVGAAVVAFFDRLGGLLKI
ncbi:hypothetical protein [Natronorubrum sulfidifaciens]|uniref:Uncharacterized protein n=1 Tax=Natronorubrum sulfidifaciens JCM 14089 TaxID=1230460 RepID=L9WDF9_9EURY|nr:hypothetical protein [Natronorubrum sulfidifaciens]ELY47316.1 hypothetical protein C495_03622 [Natronorubrum sulfidifaciens JCM 14089]